MPSRLMQMTALLGAVLMAVAAAIGIVAVSRLGGLSEVLQLPAVLDPATPAAQDGFSLIAVMRGHPNGSNFDLPTGTRMNVAAPQTSGDTVLWIRPPELPPVVPLLPGESDNPRSNFFTIRSISSSGDVAHLPWYFEGGCLHGAADPCTASRVATSSPSLVAALIPSGYPDDVKYFKVSIVDPEGHRAIWRIDRLPRMRRTLVKNSGSSYSSGGATVSLSVVRTKPSTLGEFSDWPDNDFYLTFQPLSKNARHQWEFRPSPNYPPSLSWEPYRLPWLTGPDSIAEFNTDDSWLFCRQKVKSSVTSVNSTPYVRRNTAGVYHGFLTQFETRQDSVDLHDVKIDTVVATEAGLREDTYCLNVPHKVVLKSTSGLTIVLPKQKKLRQLFYFMVPNSLNLMWRLTPLSPGSSSQTAALLPDSPLCRRYKRPVTVWFEAFVNGKPLGYLAGVPWEPSDNGSVMIHFPAPISLPKTIDDLRITIHQRVDLKRIPVTLTASIAHQSSP